MPESGKNGWNLWADSIEKRLEDQDKRMRKLEVFVAKVCALVSAIVLLGPLIYLLIKHLWPKG